jgi:hypothetical protein
MHRGRRASQTCEGEDRHTDSFRDECTNLMSGKDSQTDWTEARLGLWAGKAYHRQRAKGRTEGWGLQVRHSWAGPLGGAKVLVLVSCAQLLAG